MPPRAAYLRHNGFAADFIAGILQPPQRGQPSREDLPRRYRNFAVLREPYLERTSRRKTNIAVVNRRGNPRAIHKVVIFEAKRDYRADPQLEPSDAQWRHVQVQLQRNMTRARRADGNVQRMYGIAAIGLHVRFYELLMTGTEIRPLHGGQVYHVENDSLDIEDVLIREWANRIARGLNH
ncbi:hypothetical protein BJY04DRAFT_214584 [Aspergillus karnatakaensis]|uniref:uncharacterized protein n=1 Tax=Aspergillus karnatakaensis TaxID=1810916 RepID=UPI003CCCFFA5